MKRQNDHPAKDGQTGRCMYSRRRVLRNMSAGVLGGLLTGGLTAKLASSSESSAVSSVVTGPIKGGKHGWPFGAYFGNIGLRAYVEEEYFIAGRATAYKLVGEQSADGRWTLEPSGAQAYRTRILVRRPLDAKKFNGTVVIEWANVSSGYDIAFADPVGLYDGYAYVAVSAQIVGLTGFPSKPMGLLTWDPERYGSLLHPGDAYSYDIFTQAARAVGPHRAKSPIDPMGGLRVRKLLGTGGSQSGVRMLSYVNGIQPREHVLDAAVLLVFLGQAAPFDNLPSHPDPGALKPGEKPMARSTAAKVREDLSIPVLGINAQTEALYYYPVRQPDTSRFVYWEVAGATHGPVGQVALIRQKTDRDGVAGPGGGKVQFSDVM
jgi:hypothetical protein